MYKNLLRIMDDCEIIYLGVKFFVFVKETLLAWSWKYPMSGWTVQPHFFFLIKVFFA